MQITSTGFIIVILAIYGFFLNKRLLYDLMIFFIPFSATAVINVGSEDSGSAVQPFMFLGVFWLIRFSLDGIRRLSKSDMLINRSELNSTIALFIFALATFASLVMPILIDGKEDGNISGQLGTSGPISFSGRNITQYIYLLYGIILSIGFYLHNREQENYERTLRIYAYSMAFVVCWGGVELLAHYKGIEFLSSVFNNSISKSAAGFNSVLDEGGMKRISSVAVEPSILVQSVLFFIPFLFVGLLKGKYILGKRKDTFFLIILYLFIFRTTSTVGIISLLLLSGMVALFYFKNLSIKKRILIIMGALLLLPILFGGLYFIFQDILNQVLFNKSDSYSSLERMSAITEAWETFLKHPVLGAGWGAVTSFDLIVKILSNTGLIGGFSFVYLLFILTRNQVVAQNKYYRKSVYRVAILISFATLVFSNIVSGFSFVFGFFWLTIGLIMVTGTKFSKI